MTILLRDVFDIPERAGVEDYVLRLTDAVSGDGARHALDDYVVTPSLVEAFDSAMGLVSNALTTGINRGAFLTGSFGSGKSHFMAVLHALLRHDPKARSVAELQETVTRHDSVLSGRNILPLAFHFLDGKSMEQVIFDAYVRHIQVAHRGTSLPALFASDALLEDAENLRQQIGDDAFLQGLGGGQVDDEFDEFSGLLGSSGWGLDRYKTALTAPAQSIERQSLVSALVGTYFKAYVRSGEYVDLDTGLAAMSAHAKSLGYDAVVLFLDELVLWLAFGMHEPEFFRRESQKLTKLVEGSYGSLEAPLVSFVARQMDLRKWFADAGANGVQQEALESAFRHQEGRFAKIELGDDNLPFVASKRLLNPKDDAGRQSVDDAFTRLDRNPKVWDVLLDGVNSDDQHRGSDEKAFRLTYPFAPALVSTLRSLASVMQRDRTALKVMQQMLVDRRNTMSIEEVIPVGDSFDYIVKGQAGAALDAQAAALFRSATQLYQDKLLPKILSTHHLAAADLQDRSRLTPAFRADDRLAKTLLLSAVAPNVPALKALTAARLASLNHGSIASPLPGGEANIVLAKVKNWSREVPEIHVGSEPLNPIIRVQLSNVDYESIVEKAKGEDNPGRQRELIRKLVAEGLGLELGDPDAWNVYRHPVVWRGSKREVELVFGNVRDAGWLTDEHFRAGAGAWRFVVDHPFDEQQHTATEDIERIENLRARNFTSRTVVWLPRFLSSDSMRDLRRLVVLDWLLEGTGDRWNSHANHLSEVDRNQARGILESQQAALREGLLRIIQQAYGAATPAPGTLLEDPAHVEVLYSLDPEYVPQPPVGATLGAGFRQLVNRAFESSYPGHPRFEPEDTEIRAADLKAVAAALEAAAADPEGRAPYPGDARTVRRIANPLEVGLAGETHFLFGDGRFGPWGAALERGLSRAGIGNDDPVTVSKLREIIAGVEPAHGLRNEVSDLIVIAWGLLRQRAWFNHGGALPATPPPGSLQPSMELRPQPMPTEEEWEAARATAGRVLGIEAPRYRTPAAVATLADATRTLARRTVTDADVLVNALDSAATRLGIDGGPRLQLARGIAATLGALQHQNGVTLVQTLAGLDLPASPEEAAASLARAKEVAAALSTFAWNRLAPVREAARGQDTRADAAQDILDDLTSALKGHEHAYACVEALKTAEDKIFDWLATAPPPPVMSPIPVSPPVPPVVAPEPTEGKAERPDNVDLPPASAQPATPGGEWRTARGGDNAVAELQEFILKNPGRRVEVQWRIVE
ncbi:DUF6079 family protein [Pseudarthrobacter sp. NIBRBAC000502771]|uniref:DUF6079 family protein n=1 Tax=Pseudarthrobacter sp. NIBRBAC000502771 TaxID=2590774 RepID=UPI001132165A|nr:DUF6079 family protein [Pseudarthrobacter sp. NIBRBAC000502771]QDG64425.1 phage resistance protein [Pseudarthrobacter sp. NIBRBAC000502771]